MGERDDDLVAALRGFVTEDDGRLQRLEGIFRVLRDSEADRGDRLDTEAIWRRVVERLESAPPG